MDRTDWHSLVARLAVEQWRLLRALIRASHGLDAGRASRFQAQARYAEQQLDIALDNAGLKLACFRGEPFEPGLPVEALNIDDYQSEDTLIVEATIDPAVVAEGRVILAGRVHVALSQEVDGESR